MDLHAFPLVAVILALAAAVGLLAVRLRQPLIVAFIGVGVLVGPVGTGWVVADGTIELLARMGIAILLFLVGLRLDPHLIRSTGPVALATGLGQVFFTSVFGYLIAIALGMDVVTALYVAVRSPSPPRSSSSNSSPTSASSTSSTVGSRSGSSSCRTSSSSW
ncbi:sodium/hydrogen exchanger family protein [Actinomycetospora cinnamomea]|uniref:Sodium/hydrogen exchanger family protein n=1 Tax=Actinomycetospora cinnamomea TaxID=663609 RepID=A0A2U1F303_9PSEU|nr:cation:proton antiporter [Actinomycetospora cinnamomea]PVZ06410.1 sodium/hydrogen exchanger family protein [Actinomycetospora cinnamomea]